MTKMSHSIWSLDLGDTMPLKEIINAIVVIEYYNDCVMAVYTFKDNEFGNSEAEELFAKLARKHGFTTEEITDGQFINQLRKDNYFLFLAYSIYDLSM